MKWLRKLIDKPAVLFHKGGKFERFAPIYEMIDTFIYTPGHTTQACAHVRDSIDLKRIMITVVTALIPCVCMAIYNSGYQANIALDPGKIADGWRGWVIEQLNVGYQGFWAHVFHGLLIYLPILIVTFAVGGTWEVIFAVVRKHEINEGFLVTGMLFPLTLPPTIPLWQVAIGISFGVVFGKEVFGGTGMNILNPALTARCFLFFAYPIQMSGDVWTAISKVNAVDGYSGATPLAVGAVKGLIGIKETVTWEQAFWGLIPGSLGETSTFCCLLGAAVLIITQVGSWRIMLSGLLGMIGFSLFLNFLYSSGISSIPLFSVPPYWHLVLGGFAFGMVFMATDPVSASLTETGKYIYGFLIGIFILVVRCINPAYPEGVMLAILFMNVMAPIIDYFVIRVHVRRRSIRSAA